jgi:type I restriction enzyme M protein
MPPKSKRVKSRLPLLPGIASDPRPTDTEVEAYDFIRRRLRELEWVVKNPSLNTGGQVWTQNQCFAHPEIKRALGLTRPENIIKLRENAVWVIEAKPLRKQLAQAVDEAVNFYSKAINKECGKKLQALIASGVAGNEESGYLVKTMICLGGKWRVVTINGHDATGLLSPIDVKTLLTNGESDIHEFAPPSVYFFKLQNESMKHSILAVSTKMIAPRQWPHFCFLLSKNRLISTWICPS